VEGGQVSAQVPTELGPYGIIAGVIMAIGLMIVAVTNYLDRRANWAGRIQHLEEQVARLENGHAVAQGFIVQAMGALPKELQDVAAFLIQASKALT
jgi:hypothetical protein